MAVLSLHLTHNFCSVQISPPHLLKTLQSITNMVQGPSCETKRHYSSTENICFLWYIKVQYCVHICPSWLYILSQTNPVRTLPNYFLKVCLNRILTSAHRSPKWSPSFWFSIQIFVHISFSHVHYITHPYQSS
jgi:hypothetical protein